MSRYDDQVLDEFQRPVPGVSVYVYDDAGGLDTLTDDLAAPLANPLTTDADGMFYFNAADGEKLLDFRFGGRTRYKEAILVGPLPEGPIGPAAPGYLPTGAAADGVTDDNAAFQAINVEDRGRGLIIPSDKYRLSAPQIYRSLVNIEGQGFGQNPGTVDGVAYPYPTLFNGSVLYTDANVTGIEFQPFTSEPDVATVLADLPGHKTQQSAYGSRVSGLIIASAGNGAVHAGKRGLYSRTRIFAENVWAYGHGAEGVRIEATSDVPDGHAYGNANLTTLIACDSTGNAGDGFYFGGRDMNACAFVGLNASNNGGWGFQDRGLLGNTYVACHAAGNTAGSFKATSAVAANLYLGCYDEIDAGKLADLPANCMVIGGSLAFDACHPANSTAFVFNAGEAIRKGISGLNNLNATSVRAGLGRDPSVTAGGKIAQWFGTPVDPGGTSDEHRLKYEFSWTGVWAWTYRNALDYMEFPSGQASFYATLANPMAVGFPQGIALGTVQSAPRICPSAAAAPVAGTYRRGDIVFNNAPAAGGVPGWMCVAAGTPGTWKAMANLAA